MSGRTPQDASSFSKGSAYKRLAIGHGIRACDREGLDRTERVGFEVEEDINHPIPLGCSIPELVQHHEEIYIRFFVRLAPHPGSKEHDIQESIAISGFQPPRRRARNAQALLWVFGCCKILAFDTWQKLGHPLMVTLHADWGCKSPI